MSITNTPPNPGGVPPAVNQNPTKKDRCPVMENGLVVWEERYRLPQFQRLSIVESRRELVKEAVQKCAGLPCREWQSPYDYPEKDKLARSDSWTVLSSL